MKNSVIQTFSTAIFCGGYGTRMGCDKASLPIDGSTLLQTLSNRFSSCPSVYLSVGEKIGQYHCPNTIEIPDIYKACGPLGGLHAILRSAETPWVFVIACDMPYMNPSFAEYLINEHLAAYIPDSMASDPQRTSDHSVPSSVHAVIPAADGRIHPLAGFYHTDLLPLLEKQLQMGNYRMRDLFTQVNTTVIEVKDPEMRLCLSNLNTQEDWVQYQRSLFPIPVIACSGFANSGKTTLLCKLIKEISSRGGKVGVIKHTHHPQTFGMNFETLSDGSQDPCIDKLPDTKRFINAGAWPVLLISPDLTGKEPAPEDAIRAILEKFPSEMRPDLLLLEGFKNASYPAFWLTSVSSAHTVPISKEHILAVIREDAAGQTGTMLSESDIPVINRDNIPRIMEILYKQTKLEFLCRSH